MQTPYAAAIRINLESTVSPKLFESGFAESSNFGDLCLSTRGWVSVENEDGDILDAAAIKEISLSLILVLCKA